jgi:hypothetical protein
MHWILIFFELLAPLVVPLLLIPLMVQGTRKVEFQKFDIKRPKKMQHNMGLAA